MGVAASIVSVVLKSVVEDKLGSGLVKDLIGISIDGISEKGINEITDFINREKSKIDSILSNENMKSMGIPEDNIDYIVAEIKELLSKINITDEVLRQCKYDSMNLSAFLWDKYRECKNDYIECESEIKRCIFAVAEALIKLVRESENFEKDVLIQISNSVDDTNVELQKVYDYIKDNFDKLDDNSQIILNILSTILKQFQKMNIRDNETISIMNETKKSQSNKKGKYIENWNSRLFLHVDNNENPVTLADAFIVPNFNYYIKGSNIKFSNKDSLINIINKFIKYNKTSNMLITGSPGIGKTSIVSWIANKYKDYNDLIVLRFRDWSNKDLEQGILNAIYSSLDLGRSDLENKILVLDGFDEIKTVNERKNMIRDFLYNALDFDNLKIIVTSRHNYLDEYDFQNAFELLPFNISQIREFYQIIKGIELDKEKIDCDNLDVLGIPVILYMAIMADIDLTLKTTKPELYNRIFAEEGGIFDRFCFKGVGYDGGYQPLRDKKNTSIYLSFLRQVAFSMFEKNDLILIGKEYDIPELVFQREKLKVVEFPIKPFFESDGDFIEFIHKSIYDYFVAEYIFTSIYKNINIAKEGLADILGCLFKKSQLTKEILEFLKYRVRNESNNIFCIVYEVFQLMVQDGMTYYITKSCKNVIDCEMKIFTNMFEILHLWDDLCLKFDDSIRIYLKCKGDFSLKLNLQKVDLSGAKLGKVNLEGVNLRNAKLGGTHLAGANLKEADLRGADLKNAYLAQANLKGAYLECADLKGVNLHGAELQGAWFDEGQVLYLDERYNLFGVNIYMEEIDETVNYLEYRRMCEKKSHI